MEAIPASFESDRSSGPIAFHLLVVGGIEQDMSDATMSMTND
jgi:hypothetical protein